MFHGDVENPISMANECNVAILCHMTVSRGMGNLKLTREAALVFFCAPVGDPV
jgi:hypothetical protein